MTTINIKSETDTANGWLFEVEAIDAAGMLHEYQVTLGWRDYDHWCRGQVAPSRVIEAAFEFLLQRQSPAQINAKFDCAVIRRHFHNVDSDLPGLL